MGAPLAFRPERLRLRWLLLPPRLGRPESSFGDDRFEAGVERVVHVSITNPSLDSPLPYFRGKAEVEAALDAAVTEVLRALEGR